MRIGLIDLDNSHRKKVTFPNIALMKISAYHKKQGDTVEWYEPMFSGHMDKVYISKVFSFTPDYEWYIDADEIIMGGSGYAISMQDGKEVYAKSADKPLSYEIEHVMPDYSIYNITDTAYGFLSRGCPRGCDFCHVKAKEGALAHKVADLSEFWDGQKNIEICDPNILACKDWEELLQQLADSKAWISFNQGLDIRLMTAEKAEMLKKIRIKAIHFAFDRYQDWKVIVPKLEKFSEIMGEKYCRSKISVFVLCNFNTTLEQDLERIQVIKSLSMSPYVMLYDKEHIPKGHKLRHLQRYVNNRFVFWSNDCPDFEAYMKGR